MVIALLVFAGIYVTLWPQRNGQGVAACGGAAAQAAALRPLATGALAAFAVADHPGPVPAISFVDGTGERRTLADWRGKVVVLNLWATWCVPCKREMPELDRLQGEVGGDDFEVVAINLDRSGPQPGRDFYQETGLEKLGFYHDPDGRIFRDLRALGMPTTLLVDKKGCELGRLAGPADWAAGEALELVRAALAGTAQ
ncbi:MAG TPA: TlpA disulfide reductase family protein [Hyphomicrobiales bacterium]|nr:TlpA disulfide reductase family protein [Hyphomicrobiales bacterium]